MTDLLTDWQVAWVIESVTDLGEWQVSLLFFGDAWVCKWNTKISIGNHMISSAIWNK